MDLLEIKSLLHRAAEVAALINGTEGSLPAAARVSVSNGTAAHTPNNAKAAEPVASRFPWGSKQPKVGPIYRL